MVYTSNLCNEKKTANFPLQWYTAFTPRTTRLLTEFCPVLRMRHKTDRESSMLEIFRPCVRVAPLRPKMREARSFLL